MKIKELRDAISRNKDIGEKLGDRISELLYTKGNIDQIIKFVVKIEDSMVKAHPDDAEYLNGIFPTEFGDIVTFRERLIAWREAL